MQTCGPRWQADCTCPRLQTVRSDPVHTCEQAASVITSDFQPLFCYLNRYKTSIAKWHSRHLLMRAMLFTCSAVTGRCGGRVRPRAPEPIHRDPSTYPGLLRVFPIARTSCSFMSVCRASSKSDGVTKDSFFDLHSQQATAFLKAVKKPGRAAQRLRLVIRRVRATPTEWEAFTRFKGAGWFVGKMDHTADTSARGWGRFQTSYLESSQLPCSLCSTLPGSG